MTEGNGIYHKNERVNDSELNFPNIPNKNMNPDRVNQAGEAPQAPGLIHEVWIHIFMRDVWKVLRRIVNEFIFVW